MGLPVPLLEAAARPAAAAVPVPGAAPPEQAADDEEPEGEEEQRHEEEPKAPGPMPSVVVRIWVRIRSRRGSPGRGNDDFSALLDAVRHPCLIGPETDRGGEQDRADESYETDAVVHEAHPPFHWRGCTVIVERLWRKDVAITSPITYWVGIWNRQPSDSKLRLHTADQILKVRVLVLFLCQRIHVAQGVCNSVEQAPNLRIDVKIFLQFR